MDKLDYFKLYAIKTRFSLRKRAVRNDGGPGSGNFGHKGRPGKIGGAAPSEGGKGTVESKEGVGKANESRKDAIKRIEGVLEDPKGVLVNKDGKVLKNYHGSFMDENCEIHSPEEWYDDGFYVPHYNGETDIGFFKDGNLAQSKYMEMVRNQGIQEGKATLTSQEAEDMYKAVKTFGTIDGCQKIGATQNPESVFQETLDSMEKEGSVDEYTKHAENMEKYIALSDKRVGYAYRGVTFNTAFPGEKEKMEKLLASLKEGNEITMGRITSWSSNENIAMNYSLGALEDGFEDGEAIAILFRSNLPDINDISPIKLLEKSKITEPDGSNPSGECYASKDAKWNVQNVFNEESEFARKKFMFYEVWLEEKID